MSAGLISFLAAISFATWIWTKVNHSTGSADSKTSLIVAAAAGVGLFVVVFTFLTFVIKF